MGTFGEKNGGGKSHATVPLKEESNDIFWVRFVH